MAEQAKRKTKKRKVVVKSTKKRNAPKAGAKKGSAAVNVVIDQSRKEMMGKEPQQSYPVFYPSHQMPQENSLLPLLLSQIGQTAQPTQEPVAQAHQQTNSTGGANLALGIGQGIGQVAQGIGLGIGQAAQGFGTGLGRVAQGAGAFVSGLGDGVERAAKIPMNIADGLARTLSPLRDRPPAAPVAAQPLPIVLPAVPSAEAIADRQEKEARRAAKLAREMERDAAAQERHDMTMRGLGNLEGLVYTQGKDSLEQMVGGFRGVHQNLADNYITTQGMFDKADEQADRRHTETLQGMGYLGDVVRQQAAQMEKRADVRHEENAKWLDELDDAVGQLGLDVSGMRRDLRAPQSPRAPSVANPQSSAVQSPHGSEAGGFRQPSFAPQDPAPLVNVLYQITSTTAWKRFGDHKNTAMRELYRRLLEREFTGEAHDYQNILRSLAQELADSGISASQLIQDINKESRASGSS